MPDKSTKQSKSIDYPVKYHSFLAVRGDDGKFWLCKALEEILRSQDTFKAFRYVLKQGKKNQYKLDDIHYNDNSSATLTRIVYRFPRRSVLMQVTLSKAKAFRAGTTHSIFPSDHKRAEYLNEKYKRLHPHPKSTAPEYNLTSDLADLSDEPVSTASLTIFDYHDILPAEDLPDESVSTANLTITGSYRSVTDYLNALETLDDKGFAPFHYDCMQGDMEAFTSLEKKLNYGQFTAIISMETSPADGHRTPLMIAAKYGHIELVKKLLIDARVARKVDHKDDNGMTAYDYAVKYGRQEIVDYLREFIKKRSFHAF